MASYGSKSSYGESKPAYGGTKSYGHESSYWITNNLDILKN
jgi:hypothetical protein